MFDIGFLEICLVGVVALLVVGPERLPRLARSAGLWLGRARRFMSEVKSDIKAEMEQEDLQALRSIKNDLEQTRSELEKAGDSMNQKLSDDAIMEEIERPASVSPAKSATRKATKKGKTKKSSGKKVAKKVSKTGKVQKTKAAKSVKSAKTAKTDAAQNSVATSSESK